MDTRREFLKKASLLAGGAGILSSLPASIQKAIAINPAAGTTFEDAEHVVFLMQENRSFDHCFGTLQGVRGFNDPRAITIPGNVPVWLQQNEHGVRYAPFRLNMKDTRATWMGGLPHSWSDQVDARNEGIYDKWLIAKKTGGAYKGMPLTLGYYNREDIPFYYALADAFTICDQHFSASLTGTTANRSFFWTGTIRERPGTQANVRNSDTYYNREADWKTFPERLEENGISWRVYQNELSIQTVLEGDDESWLANFTDNNLEWFRNYNVRFHKAHYDFLVKRMKELPAEIEELRARIKRLAKNEAAKLQKTLHQKIQQLKKYKNESSIWNPSNFEKLSSFEKGIHKKAFTTNVNDPNYHQTQSFVYDENGIQRELRLPKGDILHQFRHDVNAGKLPTVSWLVAPQYFSDHPSAPWFGAWYVSEVLDILTKNPEVWKKTIFILNYDENDGYFDHVPPYTAPKPNDPDSGKVPAGIDTAPEFVSMQEELAKNIQKKDARESPVGLGYRVPLIIASPWTRGGWVNSEVCDITSSLMFLEKFLKKKTGKSIIENNISDWRRMVSGDLISAFRPYNGEKIELPPSVEKAPFVKQIYNAKFKQPPSGYKPLTDNEIKEIAANPASSLLPGQEQGIKNSCALPYELHVEGKIDADGKNYTITFAAKNEIFSEAAGAPFNVFAMKPYRIKGIFEEVKAWSFAVNAGGFLDEKWPLDKFKAKDYHFRVYGPNGFFREFSGNKNDPKVEIFLEYEKEKHSQRPTGNIIIHAKNKTRQDHIIQIKDMTYGQGVRTITLNDRSVSGETLVNLANTFNWYDISVKIDGTDSFEKRYAGRVETGSHSKTDPFMGKEI